MTDANENKGVMIMTRQNVITEHDSQDERGILNMI